MVLVKRVCEDHINISVTWEEGKTCPLCAAYESENLLFARAKEAEILFQRILTEIPDLGSRFNNTDIDGWGIQAAIGRWLGVEVEDKPKHPPGNWIDHFMEDT